MVTRATKVRPTSETAAAAAGRLDRTDRTILRTLQHDASLSNVALAAKALGLGMLVAIGVVLDRSTPESFAAFEKAAVKISGCLECHVVTGEFDYLMLVRTADHDGFNRLHAEQLLYLPGVRQIRSFIVLREVLSTTELPL